MRKPQTLLVGVACLGLLIIAFAAHRRTPEPAYGGHRLSFWVEILGRRSPPWGDKQGATNAIDHIGAASLPFLLRWIQHEPAQWRAKLSDLLERLPNTLTHRLSACIAQQRSEQLAIGSYNAFQVLGTRAMPALDDLCRLMNTTNATSASARATENLECLGTNALPGLLAVIKNPQHPRRWQAVAAVRAIPNLDAAAHLAVPAIISCLADTNDESLLHIAADALGRLKAAPDLSIPALISCLQTTNAELRAVSAEALGAFGPQGASAIPALTNALTDSDPDVRERATEALHEIAPATFTNAPPPRHID